MSLFIVTGEPVLVEDVIERAGKRIIEISPDWKCEVVRVYPMEKVFKMKGKPVVLTIIEKDGKKFVEIPIDFEFDGVNVYQTKKVLHL